MKPLMLIPPAQAEALYDAREEQPDERFWSLPWQDEDTLQDAGPPAKAPLRAPDKNSERYTPSQIRAA